MFRSKYLLFFLKNRQRASAEDYLKRLIKQADSSTATYEFNIC
jgi:hypothetical protein